MRCDNCGWSNPDGLTKCQKCNQDLNAGHHSAHAAPAAPAAPAPNPFTQTVIDPNMMAHAAQSAAPAPASISCSRCGYPLSAANSFCPNCGTAVESAPAPQAAPAAPAATAPQQNQYQKTVRVLPEELMRDDAAAKYQQTVRVLPEELMMDDAATQPLPQQPQAPETKPAPAYKKTTREVPEVLKATVREIPVELMEEAPAATQPSQAEAPASKPSSRYQQTMRVLPEEFMREDAATQPLPMPQETPAPAEAPAPVAEPAPVPEPVQTPSFRLVPMDNFCGSAQTLVYEGDSVVEGKDVDSPLADVQAAFECVDGQWSVCDKGGRNTVFVCASRKVDLQKGDVVVIGNRRYIFE